METDTDSIVAGNTREREREARADTLAENGEEAERTEVLLATHERIALMESPKNGLAGLKEWRYDVPAALVVALVSVPLSLGIAIASGAPPICGLTSEIIAGLVFPFLGGAYVTICGPAAGLAPVLFAAITQLGHGNMEAGYHLVLGVILMTGVVQLVLTYFKAAKFSQIFPTAAIHGMLAAIGLLIIGKQIPNFIGAKFHAHEFFAVLAEAPSELINHVQPEVFSIGLICLLMLFLLTSGQLRGGFLRYMPPQLIVVIMGAWLANLFHLDHTYLVQIPSNLIEHGIVLPNLQDLLVDLSLLPTIVVFVLALTFVDGTESLATIQAVDRIDPFHRKSSADRTLFAMGISNICSSLIGGLTIIPGIIKSTTCIVSGGRTAWVNFYNAIFLILFLLIAGHWISSIPISALAAVLAHIGFKLAGPQKWRVMWHLGTAQLAIFTTTVVVTLMTDLLIGIAAGMMLKLCVLLYYSCKSDTGAGAGSSLIDGLKTILKSPLEKVENVNGTRHVFFSGAMNCFNSLKVRSILDETPYEVKKVVLHFNPAVSLVDHSTNVYLNTLKQDWQRLGKTLEFNGLADLKLCARDKLSLRYRKRGSATPRESKPSPTP